MLIYAHTNVGNKIHILFAAIIGFMTELKQLLASHDDVTDDHHNDTRDVMTHADDALQVAPSVVQGLHGEPGVGVEADVEALDLLVELVELVEVRLGHAQ